jgi:hypothetical protein
MKEKAAMAARPSLAPITRQIYFYQMEGIQDLWHNASTTPRFDPALLARDLKALQGNNRYFHVNDEYDLCLLCDGDDSFQFGKARRTDTARVEKNGTVKPLTLAQGEKLFDCIHIVFFPSGVVGAEFNLFGPKMPALTEYLVAKLTSCMAVAFDRLVHTDVMQRLDHLHEIKLIDLRIDTARSEILAPFGDGWIAANQWMNEQLGVGSIGISLRAAHTAHRPLKAKVIEAIREMVSGPNFREAADKFRIKAVPDGSSVSITIDLLEDKLMASVEIPRHIYRTPDLYRDFMYKKIRSTYAALSQDIMRAVRITS